MLLLGRTHAAFAIVAVVLVLLLDTAVHSLSHEDDSVSERVRGEM